MTEEVERRAKYTQHLTNKDEYFQVSESKASRKGKILIINNGFSGNDERKGSLKDVNQLQELFKFIGNCEVSDKKEIGSLGISKIAEDFARNADNACFIAVFVMSHGSTEKRGNASLDMVVGVDGGRVDARELVAKFSRKRSPHLCEIPKMIFFQMCRGTKADREPKSYEEYSVSKEAIDYADSNTDEMGAQTSLGEKRKMINEEGKLHGGKKQKNDNDVPDSSNTIKVMRSVQDTIINVFPEGKLLPSPDAVGEDSPDPDNESLGNDRCVTRPTCDDVADLCEKNYVEGDPNMLVSFSTLEGYKSFRNEKYGSWFIEEICHVFKENAWDDDVLTMLEKVGENLSYRRSMNSNDPDLHGCAVCSRTAHTFGGKKLFFFPGMFGEKM